MMHERPARIGVLGGTFDPIHIGHLLIAQEVCTRLDLDRMIFIPAGQPPHKRGQTISSPEQRLDMVKLAIASNPCFFSSRIDMDRDGLSFTVDTVRLLLDRWGADAEVFFLIGADSLVDLPIWRHPEHLLRLCHIVAVGRPGYAADQDELDRLLPGAAQLVQIVNAPVLDVSSTGIRHRVRQGQSIRYLVPASVETYINEHKLYIA